MAASSLTVMVQLQDQVTAPARQATKAVDQFTNSLHRSRRGANQLGENMGKTTRDTRKFAMTGLQQAGYQVGDFAVQVGAGTSAIQAFGQQGSQLLGIFGPFGAALGAVVAIAAAVGNAFAKADAEATGFAKTTEALNEAMAASATIGSNVADETDDLRKKYGKVTPEVIRLVNAQRALNFMAQVNAVQKAKGALVAYTDKVKEAGRIASKGALFRTPAENVRHLLESFEDLTEGLGTQSIPAINKLGENLRAVAGANGFEQTILAVTEAREQLARMGATGTERGQELQDALTAIAENALAVENGFTKMNEATKESFDVSEMMAKNFGQAFGDVIKGTKSASDAFKNMASSIVNSLIDILVVQRLVGSVGGDGKAGTGLAGLFSGTLPKRAMGGPVTAGQTYLVGERGPELFTSGTNGRVIPNSQMQGGATVVQNINISTGVSQTVRAEIAQLMPQIANSAKAAVLDAKQRGGTFGKAF